MKQRQEVPKPLAIAILVIMFICMVSISLQAQEVKSRRGESGKEYHQRLQKAHSWENYQNTWRKEEMSAAKQFRKDRRREEKDRDGKKSAKFLSKIERIKNDRR